MTESGRRNAVTSFPHAVWRSAALVLCLMAGLSVGCVALAKSNETTESTAKEPAKENVKGTAKPAAKPASKQPAKDAAKGAAKGSGKEAAKSKSKGAAPALDVAQ